MAFHLQEIKISVMKNSERYKQKQREREIPSDIDRSFSVSAANASVYAFDCTFLCVFGFWSLDPLFLTVFP